MCEPIFISFIAFVLDIRGHFTTLRVDGTYQQCIIVML